MIMILYHSAHKVYGARVWSEWYAVAAMPPLLFWTASTADEIIDSTTLETPSPIPDLLRIKAFIECNSAVLDLRAE